MTRVFVEGSEALAAAAIAAGCRFFAGYPMTPFTGLLDHMAKMLPEAGGVVVNAESELEAVGMAWGALATGARAATGSTGQGLSLMQESLSEITRAELPLVVFNLARGQADYFQATRGGGHGDYRHIVLAPIDIHEAVAHTQMAFHLADRWRNPVLIYGDYLLAHTYESVDIGPMDFPELPPKDWAVDGSLGGTGRSRRCDSSRSSARTLSCSSWPSAPSPSLSASSCVRCAKRGSASVTRDPSASGPSRVKTCERLPRVFARSRYWR